MQNFDLNLQRDYDEKIYTAKEGERLDSIVYKHYKSLEYFEQVLKLNMHLNPVLSTGIRLFYEIFA